LEDRRKAGESSCNFGDGTDQSVQSLLFMMMMIGVIEAEAISIFPKYFRKNKWQEWKQQTHYLVNMWSVFHVHVYVVAFQAVKFLLQYGIT